jgi:type II protein arginine methyltransferase
MVTSPITTDLFHSRVLALLSSTQPRANPDEATDRPGSGHSSRLTVPPLSPVDTHLTPDESMSQIIATTSSWIDLCSPDPLVADVSKQVLILEIAYAAFCGISYVLIRGPRLHRQAIQPTGLMQYARVIQEVLTTGSYIQVKIWFPMIEHPENEIAGMGDLAPFARPEYVGEDSGEDSLGLDPYGTWDAWNVVRTFCKYHTRLCVGKKRNHLNTTMRPQRHEDLSDFVSSCSY